MKNLGGLISTALLITMLFILQICDIKPVNGVIEKNGKVMPLKSELRDLYLSFDKNKREDPYWLLKNTERKLSQGSNEVSCYILNGISKLVTGDVEGFADVLKKTKRIRFYKYQKEPLYSARAFVNELLNYLRDKEALLRKFKKYPRDSFIQFQFGILYIELSESSSIPYFRAAIRLNRKYYKAYLKLASIYEEMMNWDKAEAIWEKLVILFPQDYRPFFKVAHMRLMRGDFSGAQNWYHEGLTKKLYKNNFEEFRKIIEDKMVRLPSLRENREVALSKAMKLRESLKMTPNDTDVINEIAKIYYNDLHDIRMGEMWSNKQLYYDDTDYRAYLRLYKIYKRLGLNRKSMENLIMAIYEGPSKIRSAYINDLKNIVEKTLLLDAVNGKSKIDELVDYFSMYYN